MSRRYIGAVLPNGVTPTTTAASGIWTRTQQLNAVTSNTWPLAASVDPYWSNVALYLQMGVDTSTQDSDWAKVTSLMHMESLNDNGPSTRTWTASGASLSSTQVKFGTTSLSTASGYITTTTGLSDFAAGSGDFTIECWLYAASDPHTAGGGICTPQTGNGLGFGFTATGLRILNANSGTTASVNYTMGTGGWVHLAVCRSGTNVRFFQNGTQISTTQTDSTNYPSPSTDFVIGRYGTGGPSFPGYIDDFRFTKAARYTTNFSVPTAAFPDAGNGGTTFTDLGPSPNVVTATNATTNTTTKKFGTASGSFNGSSAYLTIPDSTVWAYGTNDVTIEAWVYLNTTGATSPIIGQGQDGNNWASFFVNNTNKVEFAIVSGGVTQVNVISTTSVTSGQWYHLAYVRSGTSHKVYINGVDGGGMVFSSYSYPNYSSAVVVGMRYPTGTHYLNGYIDDLRVTTNIARYTNNFTPLACAFPIYGPATAPYDQFFDDVVLSLHMDGSNGGTTFTDSSPIPKTVTATNATTSTTQIKFGSASGSFNGTNTSLNFAAEADFAFSTQDWTIEAWVYFNDSGTAAKIIDFRPTSTDGWYVTIDRDLSTGFIRFVTNGAGRITGTTNCTSGSWRHIAVCKTGTSTKLFINGVQEGSTYTDANTYICGASRPIIGRNGFASDQFLNGYIDDFRITKGVARYTANFTPPTLANPDTGGYGTWNPSDKSANVTLTVGNLKAVSNASSGAVRTSVGKSSGKWYWETTVDVGSAGTVGVANVSASLASYVGSDANGWAYHYNGQKYTAGAGAAYGATYAATDIIGTAIDLDNGTIAFYKNNVFQGIAYTGISGTLYPSVGGASGGWTSNFGQNPLRYTPPNGTFLNIKDGNASSNITNNGLTIYSTSGGTWMGNRTNTSKTTGKWYAEFVVGSIGTGNLNFGISQSTGGSGWAGQTSTSWGVVGDSSGNRATNNSGTVYLPASTWAAGDIISVALDMTTGKVWWARNGVWGNNGGVGDPALGTNPAYSTGITGTMFLMAASPYTNAYGTLNTGVTPFAYTIPQGFQPWDTTIYNAGVY